MPRALRDPTTGLTAREARFIELWIADGRKSAAATYQRFSPRANPRTASREAHRILHQPEVVAYLAKVDAKVEAKLVKTSVATREWIEQKLIEIVEIGMAAVPVYDSKGMPTGEYQSTNLSAANQSLRLLGTERGMFVEKRETGRPGEFSNVSTEDLEKRVRERSAKLGIVVSLPARKPK